MTRMLTISLAALVACLPPSPADLFRGDFSFDGEGDFDLPESNTQGRFAGELPLVGAFDAEQADVARVDKWDEHTTWIELHSLSDEGWAMLGVQVDPNDLHEGEPLQIDPELAIGCSGPEAMFAAFDGAPEQVSVEKILEVDGSFTYMVKAEFYGGDVVEGEVQAPPTDG